MDALSSEIPERAWISAFSTRGSSAKITGTASSEFVISEFIRSLQSSPHFESVNLSKIRNKKVSGKLFKSFGLSVRVDYFKSPEEQPEAKSDTDTTVVKTSDSTVHPSVIDSSKSVVTDGMEVLDKSKSKLKEDNMDDIDSEKQEKTETKKKPMTGIVGSDDGSNVIVF